MDNNTNNTIMNDAEHSIEYYKNRILSALEEYRTVNNIDDLHKISKTRWKAALAFVYDAVFKPESWHKQKRRCCIPYNRTDLLQGIVDIYIDICNEYNKDISLYGFSKIIGIDYYTLLCWQQGKTRDRIYIDNTTGKVIEHNQIDSYKRLHPAADIIEILNTAYSDMTKKLAAERQESLKSITLDGSIPALALGKIEYGWEEGKRAQIAADLLENSRTAADLLTEYKRGMIAEQTDNNI